MEDTERRLSDKLLDILVYERGEDLPFMDDVSRSEPQARITNNIYKVKGNREPWSPDLRVVKKTIDLKNDAPLGLEASMRTCRKEARIMQAARHAHAIRFYTAYFYKPKPGPMNFSIIMDRADEGDLSSHLFDSPERLQERWIGCLIHVVAHIHGLGIRHRDIKPPNILINANGDVLLADFGISHMSLGKTVPTTMPGWIKARTTTHCAPEVNEAQGRSRGRSADIFSLGAVILEVLLSHSYNKGYRDLVEATTYVPQNSTDSGRSFAKALPKIYALLDDFKAGKRPTTRPWHSEVFDLCRDMLDADRDLRPSATATEDRWNRLIAANLPGCPTCASSIPNKTKTDELLEACKTGASAAIDTLLLLPADDRPSPNTEGAMHQAAMAGSEASIRVLMDHGANVNTIDYAGQTALHYAAANGRDKVVKELLHYDDINVAAVDLEGQTPLHCAAAYGSVGIIRLLLDKVKSQNSSTAGGVARDPINAGDNNDLTPLHYAARRGHRDAVKLLLEQGANSKARERHTAFLAQDLAEKRKFPEVKKVLEDWDPKKRGE